MKVEQLAGILIDEWIERLQPFIESEEFDDIIKFINSEKKAGKKVLPDTSKVFTALNKCPPGKVKVIMGLQDPYNTIMPDGLAMSCSTTGYAQPSLKNFYKGIRDTVKEYNVLQPASLEYLADQGVLLINASLTVLYKQPNSHKGVWDKFINAVFEHINPPDPLIYMLMGKDAQEQFSKYARIGDYILTAKHPASAAYNNGVWDCDNVFNRCNTYLDLHEQQIIKW